MGWTRKSSREGRAHRRPDLECLEARQLLSLTDPVPAPSSSSFVRTNGTVDFDQVTQASTARSTFGVDGTGENVAVIDTGVDFKNPAFGAGGIGQAGDKVVAGVDFTGSSNGVLPTWQHGTGVAGLIASIDPKSPGVAPGAGIVALRVFGDDNTGSFDRIAKALDWVVQNHEQYQITAVNLSVSDGGNYRTNQFANDGSVGQSITNLVKTLDSENIPVVVASGNNFDGKTQGEGFAAIIPDTISVTATDETKIGSNKGVDPLASDAQRLGASQGRVSATDIAAPGVDVVAPSGNSGTATEEGTSFATPQVTGTIVLLQQMYQKAHGQLPTVAQLDAWLQAGADTIHDPATGIDIGRLNVAHSLAILSNQIQASTESTATQFIQATPSVAPAVVPEVRLAVPRVPSVAPVVSTPSTPPPSTTTSPNSPSKVIDSPAMTEVFVNGSSVGSVATAQLSGTYSRLFALTGGVAKNLRAWVPAGSVLDLGTVKPSGAVVAPKTAAIPTRGRVWHHSDSGVIMQAQPTRSVSHSLKPGRASVASSTLAKSFLS